MSGVQKSAWLRWLGGAATVLLTGGAGAYYLRPAPPLAVETARVERGEVQELIPSAAAGEVRPARRVTVRAELAGTVREVRKPKGERVAADEVIVRFSSDELEARVAQAKANVDAADVAIKIAQTRADATQRALERSKKLRLSEAISDVELERIETEATAAAQATEQAKAAKKQAQAAVELALVAMARAVIKAPFAGILQDVSAEVGVQLAPGAALFDLLDDSKVRVDVPVDEADVPRIAVDQTVLLYLGGRREQPLHGKVSFIPPAIGRAPTGGPLEGANLPSKDRALYVEVVPDDATHLKVGASVNAEFLVSARADVLYLPTQVVLGRGRQRSVFVIEKGKAKKLPFDAGLTSWERTEVKAGLGAGDRVISSLNLKGLDDGVRVEVKETSAVGVAP